MPNRFPLYLFLVLPFLIMCKEEDPPEMPEPQNYSLTFDISHQYNGEPMIFNETTYQNAAGNIVGFYNFKYLLSDIALIQEDGTRLAMDDTGFIDAVNDRNSFTLENIPEGDYKGIEFMIGLKEDINTADPAQYPVDHPLSPLLNGLHWSWAEGYIFLAMEGTFEKTDGIGGFTYHIAFEENQMHYSFPQSFSLDKNLNAKFNFNLAEIYTNPTVFDIEEVGNFTHSSDDNGMANTLRDNVLNALTLQSYE